MKLLILITILIFFINRRSSSTPSIIRKNLHITFKETGVDLVNDVRFFLYTRKNYKNPQQLWVENNRVIQESSYNFNKSTKFITHGWLNSYEGKSCTTVQKAFLAQDDYNVIVVDWGNVAKLSYLEAAGRIKVIGGYVAKMINFLESQGSDPNNMSLVGHSLGAQLMGLAGYQTINKVGHVVGLDPAGPGFERGGPARGLSPSDGGLVEVIHTNKGNFGVTRPLGHLDFYPNGGGPEQPGCEETNLNCAHERSYLYFAESLTRPESFLGIRCTSYASFVRGNCKTGTPVPFPNGKGMKNKTRGMYFLRTAESAPFGLGLDGAKFPPPAVNGDSKKRIK